MSKLSRSLVCVIGLTIFACSSEPERLPVPKPAKSDAGSAGNAAVGGKQAGGGGRGGASTYAGGSGAETGGSPGDGNDDSRPVELTDVQTSTSCDMFSSTAVHAFVKGDKSPGYMLTAVTVDREAHPLCGYFGDTRSKVKVRPSDGKLLYETFRGIYQYVPDPLDVDGDVDAGTADSPWANDVKLDVAMNCTYNETQDFQVAPNGEIYYSCAADSGGYYHFFDSKANKVSGSIDVWFGIGAVDNHGKFFTVSGIRLRDLLAGNIPIRDQHELVYDHTGFLQLDVAGDVECFNQSAIVAVRALDSGFLVVLQNACGLQLWQTNDKTITTVRYYASQRIGEADLVENPGVADLAADGTLYFYRLCLSKTNCLTCDAMLCAISPSTDPNANSEVRIAYPPLNPPATPVINKAQTARPWDWGN